MDTRKRLDYVDGLRAVAALMVLADHIYFTAYAGHPARSLIAHAFRAGVYGHLGVPIFLVVSGYCLMLPAARNGDMLRGGFLSFLKRRAWRILPPYYLALTASWLLFQFAVTPPVNFGFPAPLTWPGFVSHATLMQDYFHTDQLGVVFWTLAVEWKIYFVFPLLLLLWRTAGPWVTTALCFLAGVLLFDWMAPHFDRAAPDYIALFAMGMLTATITTRLGKGWRLLHERTPWLLIAGALAVIYAVVARRIGLPFLGTCASDFLGGGFGAALILAASRPGLAARCLAWKPLVFVGGYSYSVYMMHIPLLLIFVQYVLGPINWLLGMIFDGYLGHDWTAVLCAVLGVPFVLGGAYLFFLACEKPFLSRNVCSTASRYKLANILETFAAVRTLLYTRAK